MAAVRYIVTVDFEGEDSPRVEQRFTERIEADKAYDDHYENAWQESEDTGDVIYVQLAELTNSGHGIFRRQATFGA